MSLSYFGYQEALEKSLWIRQFKCSLCRNCWWGTSENSTCRSCHNEGETLQLKKMVGIGWFGCSRGAVNETETEFASKCRGCQRLLTADFVPDDSAKSGNDEKLSHR